MASRAELKARAKACLSRYYWMAFLVSLVASILGAGNGPSFRLGTTGRTGSRYRGRITDISDYFLAVTISLIIFFIVLTVVVVLSTFVGNVVQVGLCSYFLESRKTRSDAGFSRLFYGFGDGRYLNIVTVMFLKDLFIFGWSLLLIIPGIIKAYQYAMVPYILAEYPDMDYRTALKESKDMMDGHKIEYFVLGLSFIGWELLGILACCIGVIFVTPYVNATFAEFYAELRQRGYMDRGVVSDRY